MKKNITISVDVDAHLIAQQKLGNVSEYLNECLKGVTSEFGSKTEQDLKFRLDVIQSNMSDLSIERASINAKLLDIKLSKEKEKQELLEREQFKRWKCPVCQMLNFLEFDRCSKCNLPTRNDKKTVEVFLDA
jgi:hypothetical protein